METIAAIATPNGIGAISIVRISGDNALEIAKKLTKKEFTPRKATLAKVFDSNDELIDIALVIYFKAPSSFTGEDVVEFQCHGGVVVSRLILEEVLKHGARLANPGEFTKRAFLNGKIDASQAEAIAKLIETRSKEGAKLLSRQLEGDLSKFVDEVREKLIEIMAYAEVFIDYAEEDLPETLGSEIEERLQKIEELLIHTLESSKRREALLSGYKVAIVGKPNVGKSSILNALLNKQRAIVSDIAGTTRDTIEEDIQIGSHLIRIIDTAGIRAAKDEIEKIGVERSKKAIEEADIVVGVFSADEFTKEDEEILELLKNVDKEVIIVINKVDKGINIDLDKFQGLKVVKISAKKDISPLIDELKNLLDSFSSEDEHILISTRQIHAVEKALNAINESKQFLQTGELELFSYQIQDAIRAISEITKPFEYDEMLDKMFGSFCVGK
ncbi:tRNA uridine-5-carboxymethylaminomethyl(34) synthesis GTPase MnmE [Caminibacter pacificus]|uniref:tRNA modification GTPase MnmE n=1 Tax=Caminibacter pacificus TaxID=1424653 RepID=A0AAJ4RDC8_9BACT|nr:tRNA uridine-5-carboxymethylaminomethyl(34) synthesis GTPase MnmE [Caminibacter pacificus]QCI28491.1 tRNA uridine-5-carboxymethylaminomethyl(34) synthesis GTPase MnmE [Caminibacter pacificus]ROR40782.1 tRNA modification GTPase [Caminibacter pacificus]